MAGTAQCVTVLFERAPSPAAVQQVLERFGPGVQAEVLDEPWPDPEDVSLEPDVALADGRFGPLTFPGCLRRAGSHAYSWPDAAAVAARHQAVVRLGAESTQPVRALDLLTRAALALSEIPGALAYFCPAGEVLLPADQIRDSLAFHGEQGLVPLDLWANVRVTRPADLDTWRVLDTVGMRQLGVDDQEACFPYEPYASAFSTKDVANFLRNTTAHVLEHGPVLTAGELLGGPGGVEWRAWSARALVSPARRTLRWFPESHRVPDALK